MREVELEPGRKLATLLAGHEHFCRVAADPRDPYPQLAAARRDTPVKLAHTPAGPSVLVFRAVRELVTNIVKHAKATRAKVSLRSVRRMLEVGVEDNGQGFDTSRLGHHSASGGGFGLFSIREQLERAGGNMRIDSTSGRGTRIMLTVPLQPAQALRPQSAKG